MSVTKGWPLAAGLLLLSWLWLGPLADMARRAFSPHMILHLGVVVVAAPLIVIGLLRLFPGLWRPRRPLLAALAASAFEFVVVWGWHAPAMHEAAARWVSIFALQQFSFLVAGLALWWICLAGRDDKEIAIGAVAMLFTSMHMAMLGVLLVVAPTLIYAPEFCLGAFGLEPVADQRLGGGLMALLGALPFVVGGALLASRLAAQERAEGRRAETTGFAEGP
ncbi:MAG: cytochrome c oxidase assembly protein [Rhizobiaceae bacterium]|nr:cytochrome c oxidase assembly protein [Rhizobiaceae bacterium]MCV0405739.1 cytochrome c oxidase assembly protein [Rhizobiaceae bacterium]